MKDIDLVETFVNETAGMLFRPSFTVAKIDESIVMMGVAEVITELGAVFANLQVNINQNCWSLEPPHVCTHDKWLCPSNPKSYNDYADWHRDENGGLCWIRKDDWRSATNSLLDIKDVKCAAATMAKNIKALLYYHSLGHELGLKKWPKEWEFRPHGSYKE